MKIYVSHHTLKTFAYDKAMTLWKSLSNRRGVNQIDEKDDVDTLIDHIMNVSKDSNAHTNGTNYIMNMFQLP